jgi:hypothetical protein
MQLMAASESVAPHSNNYNVFLIYVALVIISITPLLLVRYPESLDYLNHLAGMFVLTVPAGHPVHAFYQPDWHLVPNLGMDVLVFGLSKMIPLELAMKAVWGLIFVALPASFLFLYTSIHRQLTPIVLLSALCLFHFPLTAGFLSFSLGLAAALAATGLWFRLGQEVTVRNILVLNAVSAVILIVHAAALGALGLTIVALHALRPPWRPATIVRRAVLAGCNFLLPLMLLLLMTGRGAEQHFPPHIEFRFLGKILFPWLPVFTGIVAADAIAIGAFGTAIFILMRFGGVRCDRRLAPALAVWAIALIVLPNQIGRAVSIDWRLVPFPVLLFLAGLYAPPARLQWAAGAVTAVAVCARIGLILPAWQDYNAAIADLRPFEQVIEPQAKVVITAAPEKAGYCNEAYRSLHAFNHVPSLLILDRHAFVPGLFSAQGMQPIKVTKEYRAISDPGAPIVEWSDLMAADTELGRREILERLGSSPWRPYYFGWRDAFDYVLVLSLDCKIKPPHDDGLALVAETSSFLLYRIVRPG